MKRLVIIWAALAAAALLKGQTGNTLPLSVPTPPGVTGGLGAVIGGLGSTPYYYWIVARYPGGNSAPSGPVAVLNGPATLSAGNFIRITWDAAPGATAYDVLRTSTPNAPVGPCGCLEAGAVTATSVTDTGSALGAYTVTTRRPSEGSLYLDNLIAAPPALQLVVDGVAVTLNGGAPSGGAIGGASAVAAGQVLFGAGPGVAGSSAEFTYNSANTELTITKAGGNWERLFLANTTANQGALLRFTNPTTNVDLGIFGSPNSGWLVFRQNAVIGMAMAPTTRNIVIGSATPTDDGTNRLQVAGSIRANDLNILDPTATIGATLVNIGTDGSAVSATNAQLIVRAGTTQGSTSLTTWQNAAGGRWPKWDRPGYLARL
jgi:hypothetical protein